MKSPTEAVLLPKFRVFVGWSSLFLLLVAGIFNYPNYPDVSLDGSWRIALAYFFKHGFQFGQDVIFTYGPLGFAMGKTYGGLEFQAIMVMQLLCAVLGACIIIHEGKRLMGLSRWAFFIAFFLFGISYEDALHMLLIALMGFQLLRRDGGSWGRLILLLALTMLASIKFTNLMLATFVIAVSVAHALWSHRNRDALITISIFAGGFIATWLLCGQNPLNLPKYIRSSWAISQGYTEAMGLPTPWAPLWKAFVVLGTIGSYLLFHIRLNPDKPKALANATLLAGFIFMNWKHGFVRADGHMIGFFFCSLLPFTTYPRLLEDPPRFRHLHYIAFLLAGGLSIWGTESALPATARNSLAIIESKIRTNLVRTFNLADTQQEYESRLLLAKASVELPAIKKVVGRASVDQLGHEQATIIFNGFNYRPRPIIQSYTVFTPYLAKLNGDFYTSKQAPDYVLLKIQTIDGRMPMMDDPEVWRLQPHRYDFVRSELGYQLWRRLPHRFDKNATELKPLLSTALPINQKLFLEKNKHIWARIELKRTLLGRLHSFLYKPVDVMLLLTDNDGNDMTFRVPLSQASAGFIISPIIEDAAAYATFANGRSGREAQSFALKIESKDQWLFANTAQIELSELPTTDTAGSFFNQLNAETFSAFKNFPVEYHAHTPVSQEAISGTPVAVLHAPSVMIFDLPKGTQHIKGGFGFLPNAYTNGGHTDGARFIISWLSGSQNVELFNRFLDPAKKIEDRGLQQFNLPLDYLSGGRLYLSIEPGPTGNFSWDWTAWSGIEIE